MALTPEQIAFRRTGVTATDIRVLSGLDPYGRTPHDVWSSKILGVEDYVSTEATELGELLEPIIIPRLAAKVGMHVLQYRPDWLTGRHATIATHIATPDALLAPDDFHDPLQAATAQVKVCGVHAMGAWGPAANDVTDAEAIPDFVLVQDVWEMHVRGLRLSFVGALIGTEVRAYRIEWTAEIDELCGALEETADRFWADHVVRRQPPPLDGSDGARRMLASLWPRNRGTMVKADSLGEAHAREYFAARSAKAEAEARQELAAQGLIALTGEADGLQGDGWRLLLKWQEPSEVAAHTRKGFRRFDLRPDKKR
jgi:hypothetical protein